MRTWNLYQTAFILLLIPGLASAQLNQERPQILDLVGVDENLGDRIPLDVRFATADGDSVTIGDLMKEGKPVLINPIYYNCPLLCGLVLEGVYKAINELRWTPGEEFTLITLSIDPEESAETARQSRDVYLASLNRPAAADGWHFLTGSESNIRAVTDALGFRFTRDERLGEYVHPASIMFLSPDGQISRYLYGLEFAEFDIRNALYEAADGRIGTPVERVVLYCFSYDLSSMSYVPVALNIMKLGGFATVLFLGIFLGLLWLREKRHPKSQPFDFQQ